MDYTNENDERKIVIVPEKKKKIESIKNKYNNLAMDDKTAEKIRKLEVTNKILKASAILVGVATAINAVIPDAIPLLDEAIMGGITPAISGASVIVSNKIEDLSKYGTTEVKTEELKDLAGQMGKVAADIKRKRDERKANTFQQESTGFHI